MYDNRDGKDCDSLCTSTLRYTISNMLWVESSLDHLRGSPLRTYHHVVAWLVPIVVAHRRSRTVLPNSCHREFLSVQQQKTA